jgi:hypothetical protein
MSDSTVETSFRKGVDPSGSRNQWISASASNEAKIERIQRTTSGQHLHLNNPTMDAEIDAIVTALARPKRGNRINPASGVSSNRSAPCSRYSMTHTASRMDIEMIRMDPMSRALMYVTLWVVTEYWTPDSSSRERVPQTRRQAKTRGLRILRALSDLDKLNRYVS